MKSIRYIVAISIAVCIGVIRLAACGPVSSHDPSHIFIFRSCSPQLLQQWQEGCRFQDYEKEENCLLWQKITSPSIPFKDIEKIVYDARLSDLQNLDNETFRNNKFAAWLLQDKHKEDFDYLLIAKEIEEIRAYMNDPWYYPYDGDEEHKRLAELTQMCMEYIGDRHVSRYGLQLMRLYFAQKNYQACIDLWDTTLCKEPQTIVRDMSGSYVAGAYYRQGDSQKAIELYTQSQDVGSLINLNAWSDSEDTSSYTDSRVKQLEYIFNRFPNSPLLNVKLQEYVNAREDFIYEYEDWEKRGFHGPVGFNTVRVGDSFVADDEKNFYDELKDFSKKAIFSDKCKYKGLWHYALAYLYYLDGDNKLAHNYLNMAEHSETSPLINESIHAFRILLNASTVTNGEHYRNQLYKDLKWLDEQMLAGDEKDMDSNWQFDNKLNRPFYYWQDVARKVFLGKACPALSESGDNVLALQLANYATNRINQIFPHFETYHTGWNDEEDPESYSVIMTFDEYRKTWKQHNWFDYSNQFFEMISNLSANDAAAYAQRIRNPKSGLDKFLNERSYTDDDYIFEIVGTLYLREMKYAQANQWLAKVSPDYQDRTNIAKAGFFRLDPFQFQSDGNRYIDNRNDYKLNFAKEMLRLENLMEDSSSDANQRANARIQYAKGLRNSFGRCWYLTQYGFNYAFSDDNENDTWIWYNSSNREGFKENPFAQKAYKKVDSLIERALKEFTDSEQAAQALLEMKNFKTLVSRYPSSRAVTYVHGQCDGIYDYALHKR